MSYICGASDEKESFANPTDDLEDDEISQFMTSHSIYDAELHQTLLDNSLDLLTLQDIKKDEVDTVAKQFGFSVKQRLRFKQLMRKIHEAEPQKEGKSPARRKSTRRKSTLIADDRMNIILIGDSGCGKTSLMNKYCKDEFSKYMSSSVAAQSSDDYGTFVEKLADGRNMELVVWDTAGQEEYQSVCRLYYKRGDAILFCYDMASPDAFKNEAYWRKAIEQHAKDDVVVVLVGCKYDLAMQHKADLYEKNKRLVEQLRKKKQWKKFNTLKGECSAKSGHNVTQVFVLAAELVVSAKKASKKDYRRGSMSISQPGAGTVSLHSSLRNPVSSEVIAAKNSGGCCG